MNEVIHENLFSAARACIDACDPEVKVTLTQEMAALWREGKLSLDSMDEVEEIPAPGRPDRPRLVPPAKVPRRRLHSEQGRPALVHAITHIEFNAINLAWDAVYRFRDMPREFYDGWVQVADEEAYHFTLLRDRLREMGYEYGDFDAHNGLWEMACKTSHDVLVRMALVPRVLEARGLDVTPGMMKRLHGAGDDRTVSLLEIILRDEVGHVAIGTRWFRYACEQRGVDSEKTFADLLEQYMQGHIRGPFYEDARMQAGFSEAEMLLLKQQSGVKSE
jgi:uncharacterized ferritin-like protein (DUF455 family)